MRNATMHPMLISNQRRLLFLLEYVLLTQAATHQSYRRFSTQQHVLARLKCPEAHVIL